MDLFRFALRYGGLGGVPALLVGQEWRSKASGVVAAAWTFDLDDFCSHIRKCLRRPRPREDSAQVENPYAREWAFRHIVSILRYALDSLIGACPFRKTGVHFSGTCARSRVSENGCHGRRADSLRAGI